MSCDPSVIMGRISYEIFGPDLPEGTTAIVICAARRSMTLPLLSRSRKHCFADCIGKTVFVAGGGSIYSQAVPLAAEMYLSTIKGDFEGDAYFPEFDANDWEITEERDEPEFVFRRYCRVHSRGVAVRESGNELRNRWANEAIESPCTTTAPRMEPGKY